MLGDLAVNSIVEMSFAECGGAVHFFERRLPLVEPRVAHAVTLVFIHGLGTDCRIWDGVIAGLPPELPLLRYDLRGHGASEVGQGSYSVEGFAADLAALLDRLELGDIVLCGLSLGGLVAQAYALRDDARLRGLVLCATAARIGDRESWEERSRAVAEGGLGSVAGTMMSRWFSPEFAERRPEQVRGHRTVLERMPSAGYRASLEALSQADLRASVASIQVPALVVAGEKDVATPPAVVRELALAMVAARFELVPGAGHLLTVEQPELVSGLIEHFLGDHGLV